MSYKIVIIDDAKIEYKKSFNWYKSINPILSERFYNSFKESLSVIKKNPLLFQIRYDDVRVKLLSDFPYLIHYKILNNVIISEAIYHSSRDGELNIF